MNALLGYRGHMNVLLALVIYTQFCSAGKFPQRIGKMKAVYDTEVYYVTLLYKLALSIDTNDVDTVKIIINGGGEFTQLCSIVEPLQPQRLFYQLAIAAGGEEE